uniref:GTD-binding domain-containing protein n=1 Tax=Oryza punctata TaxID=4537 RepID=A0A0E0M7N3_ORYPU
MESYCDKKEVTVGFIKTKRQEENEVIWRMVEQGATGDEECGGTNCPAGKNRDPGWPGTSVFRMLIPATKVGAIIGHRGERLRRLCEETKACVRVIGGHFAAAERAFNNVLNFASFIFYWKVIIFAKEQPDEPKPPAIDALLRVYEYTINDDSLDVRYNAIVVARILTPSEQAASIIGDKGSVINYIKKASKTNINVIDCDLPPVALEDDMIIEIWGLPARVHQALELVACHLRKYLVHRSVIPLFDPHVPIPISPVDMPPFHYNDHREGLLHEASPGYYSLYAEDFQLERPWTDTCYSRYPMENSTQADIFEYRQEAPIFFGRYRSVTPPHYGHEAKAYLSSPMELCLHNNLNTYGWQATLPIGRSDTVERIRSLISVYGKQAHPHPLRQTYQSTKMGKHPNLGISLYGRDDHPTRLSPSPATELPPSPAVSAYKRQVSPSLKMYPSTNVENLQHCRVSACAPEELPHVLVPSLTNQSPAVTSQIIMKMQVPIFYAEAVIGPTGARIDYIRQASGSSIVIKDLDDSTMSIEITGSAATDVQIAEQLIKFYHYCAESLRLELCLIILLHVAAGASYLATRLARIHKLRMPCILCTRMDHALHGKPWFSSDLVCAAHRSEISSLAYCSIHNNLAQCDDLCKRCSVATNDVVDTRRSKSRRPCSCCSEPFTKARNAHKISETDNVVRSSDTVHGSGEINREQIPEDHSKDKTFVVGIEEVNESDSSPRAYEQSTKNNGASGNAGTAKLAPSGSTVPMRIFVDRNSSVKNGFIGRVNLSSPRPSEIISAKDINSTTQQEVKAFLSQMSTARGLDSSWSDGASSPGINAQTDESNANGRRPSLERNYSVIEPSDANLADEVEGESSLENLKRLLELNKKSMSALYKELEEERSASAIAASQAMAMINKLHEEKAAMQMEALQYLRMMEEQADHDHEAIQNLHDLLTEREKELLDMDAELENFRRLLQNEQFNGGKHDVADIMNEADVPFEVLDGLGYMKSTMSGFEDEMAYILESISRLEDKLCVSTNRLASDNAKINQDGLIGRDDFGSSPTHGESTSDQQEDGNKSVQNHNKDNCSCSPTEDGQMSDATNLKDEVSLLHTRLKALEADQEFLKHVLSSLRCSPDGLQCVQEIASHLLELRRIATH